MEATESKAGVESDWIQESVLDPVSRTSEILFGLIMVLSFTCSISAYEAGREDVRAMLLAALGCNVAWGIIDAFFHLLTRAAERGRERLLMRKIFEAPDERSAGELLWTTIPHSFRNSIGVLNPANIRESLRGISADAPLVTAGDLKGALAVFALVFLSTLPVAIPFIVLRQPWTAMRVSNLIALLLLYGLGYSLGYYAGGRRPRRWGLSVMVLGVVLVSITIALGG